MEARRLMDVLAPWAGGLCGPAAWYLHQQGLGDLTYYACEAANPWTVALAGVLACAVVLAAGAWSAGAWRYGGAEPAFDVRRFLALISVLTAGIFTIAILFQTLAGLLIPGCAR